MENLSVSSQPTETPTTTRKWGAPAVAVATLGVTLAASDVYLLMKASRLQGEIKDLRSAVKSELTSLQSSTETISAKHNEAISDLRLQLQETGAKSAQVAAQAVSQASTAARRYSENLAKQIAQQQQQQQQEQHSKTQQYHQELALQLGEMRQVTDQTNAKVIGIATDVTSVKTEVAQTRTDLEKTIGELRSVRGDLGVQSGLIATNSKELSALRRLGEREYIEFQLTRTKAPQRIGEVAVQLKKFDARRNRYTIEVIADDKRVEKKDRGINEPVQFYMAKARVPYEIVVNEVRQDRIIGYLAAPKR